MLVGTRSWSSGKALPSNLAKRDDSGDGSDMTTTVPVTVFDRQIRYHLGFAIPAFVTLLVFAAVLFASVVSFLSGKGVPARIRHYLFHLSSGRLLMEMQYPGECDRRAPTNEWIGRVGHRICDLRGYGGFDGSNTGLLNTIPSNGQVVGTEKPDGTTQTSELHAVSGRDGKFPTLQPENATSRVPEG